MTPTRRVDAGIALVTALFTSLAISACQTPPVPSSAQAGATVLIPMDAATAHAIGYGGTEIADPQRGELVWSVVAPMPDPGAVALVTRVTLRGDHDARSVNAVDGVLSGMIPLVSVVDIPASVPAGRHDLYVRRLHEGAYSPVYTSPGVEPMELRVLPNQITVGGEVVTGAPTPLEGWSWLGEPGWTSLSDVLSSAIPRPVLEIGFSRPVASAAVTVEFPEGVVDVIRAVPPIGLSNATVWLEELAPDRVRVHAASGDHTFESLGIVFTPTGPDALDPDDEDLALTDIVLGDRIGREAVGVTASIHGVR